MSRFFLSALLVCILSTASGCSSLSKSHWKWADTPVKRFEEGKLGTPSNMVAIWTNTVSREASSAPMRGVGGRMYFYDAQHRTIQVDGRLIVYAYDDSAPDAETQQEPTRKFVFTPEQVASQFSPSEFGPSYSFWVPWDEVGSTRAKISLIPVFISSDGTQVVGQQSRQTLPGKDEPTVLSQETTISQRKTNVQRVNVENDGTVVIENEDGQSNQTAEASNTESALGISTRTISLTPSMRNQLISSITAKKEQTPTSRTVPPKGQTDSRPYDDLVRPTSAMVRDAVPTLASNGLAETGKREESATSLVNEGTKALGQGILPNGNKTPSWLGTELPLVRETMPSEASVPDMTKSRRFTMAQRPKFGKWPFASEAKNP